MLGQQRMTDMHELHILGGIILTIFVFAAVILITTSKGDFSSIKQLPSVLDELEMRIRDNETMLRHERRAAHERHFQSLEAHKALTSEK